ncbi:hypothetical protein MBM_03732 [Drepanopeziza brunnea f. sp. 'multigermtubi' MB_m1]|uniref:Uncharacterized protein n=1 Tax=Marssonina brunnea f. sp. multigermtubi (strain MB_m1) TaxID=1072389 RepID=K1WJT6_MARBU|nr:uncharacterized protein MBM_03732 [Drepanopeziza brunnea f. sp. 'multigermtubi' MB_m1]EKD17960.1 hypothetical protein MBM_03732 [Drepanopeziza brunnea f. sp. 'multigermtubi' MB_m1]
MSDTGTYTQYRYRSTTFIIRNSASLFPAWPWFCEIHGQKQLQRIIFIFIIIVIFIFTSTFTSPVTVTVTVTLRFLPIGFLHDRFYPDLPSSHGSASDMNRDHHHRHPSSFPLFFPSTPAHAS